MSNRPRSACSPAASPRPSCAGERARAAAAETALGALLGHITGGADADTYQPMNVNFGLFPPIEGKTKKADRKLYTSHGRGAALRALAAAGAGDEGGRAWARAGSAARFPPGSSR
jgi:folate-dependent tRNA-U54 methylase TrmFO/GidA